MTILSVADLKARMLGKLSGSPYKLHYRTLFQGLPISIENRVGSKRKWGKEPHEFTKMKLPYGYIRGAEGYDGDEVDVFIGPNKKSEFVFIVNQRQARSLGKFDEHKVMLGFDDMRSARKGYLDHYSDIGPKLIGSIRMWTMARFKEWLASARATDGPVRKSLTRALEADEALAKAGPFVGPRGGKWADARHTIPWKEASKKLSVAEIKTLVDEHGTPVLAVKVAEYIDRNSASRLNMRQVKDAVFAGGDWYFKTKIPLSRVRSDTHGVVTPSGKEDLSKPIVVGDEGAVLDGRHRVELARSRGLTELEAYVPAAMLYKRSLRKSGGPFVGPRGGLYADPQHKTAWKPDFRNMERNEARINALGRQLGEAIASGNESNRRYTVQSLEEAGVTVHPEAKGEKPKPKAPLRKVLFHSAPAHAMSSIQSEGLKPREGAGLFEHGGYSQHSQGKVFLSDNFSAAKQWHGKVEDQLFDQYDDEVKHDAVMLRVKHRRTARDKVGDDDVSGSRQTKKVVPPEHLEYHDKDRGWRPVSSWRPKRHSIPESEDRAHALKKSFHSPLIKAGPFIGPRGGKWADAKHTIAWRPARTGGVAVPEKEIRAIAEKFASHGGDGTIVSASALDGQAAYLTVQTHDGRNVRVSIYTDTVPVAGPSFVNGRLREHAGGLLQITVGLEAAASIPPKFWAEAIRQTIAHELTHVMDPNKGGQGEAVRLAKPEDKARVYYNSPTEVRAHLTEMVRDLKDARAKKRMKRYKDPVAWASRSSEVFSRVSSYLDAKNERLFLRAIADVWTAHKDDTLPSFEKSVYIGPKGGKWADAKHTKPWREEHHAEVTEDDTHFATGKPVLVKVTHRKQKTGRFGSQYGQGIEPHGRYVVHGHIGKPGKTTEAGGHKVETIHDTVRFKNPLVLHHGGTGSEPGMWKRRLSDEYGGKKGKALSRALAKKGHDAIVTVDKYGTSEIVDLTSFRKSLLVIPLIKAQRPPAGFMLIPGGKRGGYRKKKGKGWVYWYPQAETKSGPKKPTFEWGESKWTEAEFAKGDFDTDPAHWQPYHARKGAAQIGGAAGGVRFDSKHPVKEGGLPHRLYQVVSPPHEGWAKLRDVHSGEEREVAEGRVMPVYHRVATKREKEQEKERDQQQAVWKPPRGKTEPSPTGASSKARRIAPFEDTKAAKGTALYAMESGRFLRHTEEVYETDASGNAKGPITREKTHVDEETKVKLVSEFSRMLTNAANRAKKRFGLKSRYSIEPGSRRIDETLVDLRMSAIEGLLIAVERYEGGGPFAPFAGKFVDGHTAIQAAREFSGGIALPKRVHRMLSGFIAARVEAGLHGGEPTPKQIARAWDLRKWQLHSGIEKDDPQYSEAVPMRPYKLKRKERVVTATGGRKKVTIATDTKEQVGKLVWAQRMHSFVTGQATARGSDFFDESASVFPTVATGVGLSPREKVDVRASIEKVLPELREHTITITTGRQSSTYRTDSGAIITKKLGLEGDLEEVTDQAVAEAVTIERKTSRGWRPLGQSRKEALISVFMERGLDTLREKLTRVGSDDVSRLVGIAQKRLAPEERARPGLTYKVLLQARARDVTQEQVAGWRKKERTRLRSIRDRMRERASAMEPGPDRDHQRELAEGAHGAVKRIDRIGRREIALRIAHSQSSETSEAIRRMQFQTVEVDHQSPGYEYGWSVSTMTDPATGRQRRVRVRTMRREQGTPAGQPLKKGDAPIEEGVLHDMLRWPRLTALLWARESIPTVERYQLETLVGLH